MGTVSVDAKQSGLDQLRHAIANSESRSAGSTGAFPPSKRPSKTTRGIDLRREAFEARL